MTLQESKRKGNKNESWVQEVDDEKFWKDATLLSKNAPVGFIVI